MAGLVLLLGQAWANPSEECAEESHFPEISKNELKKVVQKKSAFIVDVNSEDSFKEKHVPGAIHYDSRHNEFSKLLPKDKGALVVAYCGGPQCGAWKKAATEACELGYTNIRHFKGGISGWKASS